MAEPGEVEYSGTERRQAPSAEAPSIFEETEARAAAIYDYIAEKSPSREEAIELIQNALLDIAFIDTRTKLLNLVGLHYELSQAMRRANNQKIPLSVLFLDADHFKDINDTYGHRVGDLIIEAMGEGIKEAMRGTDAAAHVNLNEPVAATVKQTISQEETAARPGGDEFVVIMAGSDLEGAEKLSQRIKEKVTAYLPTDPDVPKDFSSKFTMTIGMAQYDPLKDTSSHLLLEKADLDMIERKKARGVARSQSEEPKT